MTVIDERMPTRSAVPSWRRAVRGITGRLLRYRPVGHTACRVAYAIGLEQVSRRMSRQARYVPDRVPFEVPGRDGTPKVGWMFSGEGTDYIVRSIWTHGLAEYEAPLPRLYARAVRGAKQVLDVGANSGLYAIIAALAEPGLRVHSFEPFPPALHWLRENITLNKLDRRVEIIPAAVGAEAGTVDLFVPAKEFGDTLETSASLDPEFRKDHSEVLKVEALTLDDYVRRAGVGAVDVLRADVEAAEHLVLGGAAGVLQGGPLVLVEVLTDAAAAHLEPLRARWDYHCLCLLEDRLVELPAVTNVAGHSNQLWYHRQRRQQIQEIAEELKMPLVQSA